jgi:hypothetical protein
VEANRAVYAIHVWVRREFRLTGEVALPGPKLETASLLLTNLSADPATTLLARQPLINRPFNDSNVKMPDNLSGLQGNLLLMNSLSALSPLTASSQPNASIVFQGETFPIFKGLFTTYSRAAAEHDRPNHFQFVVTSPVTRESVITFVEICQGKPASFSNSQVLDLLSLCDEWSVDSLKAHLLTVIEHDDDQILTCLRYGIERGIDTSEVEGRARGRFCALADRDELLELPISVLRRIIDVGVQETDF